MTKKLQDPDLPPGEIVGKHDEGVWVRNDGVKLHSAEKNPFYVLGTVFGEQEVEKFNPDGAAENRRIWNGWVCSKMTDASRTALAGKVEINPNDLVLDDDDLAALRQAFVDRLGPDVDLPEPGDVDFRNTLFQKPLHMEGFVFPAKAGFKQTHFGGNALFHQARFCGEAVFDTAHFARDAGFGSANFGGYAGFNSAYFDGYAWFKSAHFSGDAWFNSAHFDSYSRFDSVHFGGYAGFNSARFVGDAGFNSARFIGDAGFGSAHFDGGARFDSAHFGGHASFSDGAFAATTSFQNVVFDLRAPNFFQRQFHDDTRFTATAKNSEGGRHWPTVNLDWAQEDKDAYRRLRQVSVGQHNPENEHFFLRQEMACDAALKTGLSRWVIQGFGLVSDYGYSLWRPVIGLIGTVVAGALAILAYFAWAHVYGQPPDGMKTVPGMFDALGLGIANTFSIFGFRSYYLGGVYMVSLPLFVKIIGGAQTILGFVFLFFLGLGLRNRFRLK